MELTWEQIKEEFSVFGSTFADDVIPERCVALCKKNQWDAAGFYDEWIAWSKCKSEVTDGDLEKMIVDIAKNKKNNNVTTTPVSTRTQKRTSLSSPAIGTPKRQSRSENILSASFADGSDSTPARVYKSGKKSGHVAASYQGKLFKETKQQATKIQINVINDLVMNGRLQNKNRTEMNMAALERLGKLKENFHLNENTLKDIGGGFVETGDLVYGMLRPPKKENLPFVLYGDYETSRSSSTQVLPKFPAFAGEVIVGKVGNSAGQAKFLDEQLLPSLPPLPPKVTIKENVRIVVSAGPYTTIDTLSYEPYHDFVTKMCNEQPDILVMIGPFVDRNHKKLSTNLDCKFEAYFNQLLDHLSKKFSGKRTRLFIVSNYRENHTTSRAFPTVKYSLKSSNITCLNDPAILDVNGIHVALSSTDVFRALAESTVNVDDGVDIIQLSARKLLEQRSFYPVFPPHGDLIVRLPLANQMMFDVRPHLFVLPATVAPFVRAEEKCLFVNPGSLVKGMDAGCYATIDIGPCDDDSIEDTSRVNVVRI